MKKFTDSLTRPADRPDFSDNKESAMSHEPDDLKPTPPRGKTHGGRRRGAAQRAEALNAESGNLAPEPGRCFDDVTGKAEAAFAFDEIARRYFTLRVALRLVDGALVGNQPAEFSRVTREINITNTLLAPLAWRLSGRFVIFPGEIRFELKDLRMHEGVSGDFDHALFAKILNAVEAQGALTQHLELAPEHQQTAVIKELQAVVAKNPGIQVDRLNRFVDLLANGDALAMQLPHGNGTDFRPTRTPRNEDVRPADPDELEAFEETVIAVDPHRRLVEFASGRLARIPNGQVPTDFSPGDVVRFTAGSAVRWIRKVFQPAGPVEKVRRALIAGTVPGPAGLDVG